MNTILVCAGVYGDNAALEELVALAESRKPDCILFAGGIIAPESKGTERARFFVRFLAALGGASPFSLVIPGTHDTPLTEYMRAAITSETVSPHVFSAHAVPVIQQDVAVLGLGGSITDTEDSQHPSITYSHTTAEYFFKTFLHLTSSIKIMMLHEIYPNLMSEFLKTYRPFICVKGGDANYSSEVLPHTLRVNPGHLIKHSAAWITRQERKVEKIDL